VRAIPSNVGISPIRSPLLLDPPPPPVTGVSNNPYPVPSVRSAEGGSGNTVPLRIIPERSEPPEHLVQSASAKGRDVFDDDVARPDFLDEPGVFAPEPGSLAVKPGTLSGDAKILAVVNSNSICDITVVFLNLEVENLLFDPGSRN
jgi:hypothetical protein